MKRLLLTIPILLFTILTIVAQDSVTQQKAEYNELIRRESSMQRSLDSLQTLLATSRNLFDSQSQPNDSLSNQIIKLEGAIYDTRSQLSRIGTQIAMLEAALEKYDAQNPVADGGKNVAAANKNLLRNEFFVTNVSPKDLIFFAQTPQAIAAVNSARTKIGELRSQLVLLKGDFDNAPVQDDIDAMIIQAADIKREITAIDKQAAEQWNDLYNRKLDNYLILIDKLGGVDRSMLESLDLLSREALHMQNVGETSLAPTLTAFNKQQELLIAYEKILADKLKLAPALDSLKTVATKIQNQPVEDYSDVEFPYRSLVVYAPITIGHQYGFTDINETPKLKLPSRGAYYAVQVALVNGTASSLAIFKGAQPLQVEKTASGQSRYVLGGFKTYDEGYQAVKQCYSDGFKNPILVAWVNGVFTTPAKAKAYQAANPDSNSGADFKIEIITSDPSVAATLKSTLDMNAPGKTITRTEQNGQYTYTIMQFATREEAQVIAHIIKTKEPSLSQINVSSL